MSEFVTTQPHAPPPAPSHVRYLVLFWLCAASFIAYTQRNTLGVVEKELRRDLGLSYEQSAWAMTSSFFITYALFQVPTGWLGHVWGTRRALALFSAVCSVATGLCAAAEQLWTFITLRGTMGVNQAGLFPCTTGTVKTWFPGSQWGFANGFITASQQVGGAGGAIIATSVAVMLGWRWTFVAFAIPGLVWSIWFYYWFRDQPEEHPAINAGELALLRGPAELVLKTPGEQPHEPIPWAALLLSPALFWICAQQFFRGAGYIFYSTWFTTYLRESRGVDLGTAGWLTSLPLWANAIGCVAGGRFSDWLLVRTGSRRISRQGLAVCSQWAGAVFVLIAYPVHDATIAVLILSVGSFCTSAGGPVAYSITIDMGGKHVRPVFSLMNMWGNLGSFTFPLVVGMLVGKGPSANWDSVLPVFAGIYAVAGLCWLGFNPDRPILTEPEAENGDAIG